MQNVVGRPLLPCNEIWAGRGDLIAYRLVLTVSLRQRVSRDTADRQLADNKTTGKTYISTLFIPKCQNDSVCLGGFERRLHGCIMSGPLSDQRAVYTAACGGCSLR